MLCNQDLVLIGENVLLVPYQAEHVPKYHAWMQNEELRVLTASEPLTLEQEFEMQQRWRNDEDKLTFIILANEGTLSVSEIASPKDPRLSQRPMIGDVNVFFSGSPGTQKHDSGSKIDSDDEEEFTAEAEIMIAEPSFRRKGFAKEALQLMFSYVTGCPPQYFTQHPQTDRPPTLQHHIKMPNLVPPTCLITRISDTNLPSIKLFESLGFRITKEIKVFEEVEMGWYPGTSE
ncbi:hypothetical protein GYMLUDRAFT_161710 [Collybiopsis luxurians FD-317 M1]|uniref:N-acetyltransferase domain-containing protein n=1 Tax=Collybiopsis luxurians FD-317 M1 TaxID=944289 RepID=A0A0D0C7D2_9AGAR|nr:hypothetical protein GYMLUDRAFT_161710 [Collybiopsis luxurians FD-317 M1]